MGSVGQTALTCVCIDRVLDLKDPYSLSDVRIECLSASNGGQSGFDNGAHPGPVVNVLGEGHPIPCMHADDVLVLLVVSQKNLSFGADEAKEVIAAPSTGWERVSCLDHTGYPCLGPDHSNGAVFD